MLWSDGLRYKALQQGGLHTHPMQPVSLYEGVHKMIVHFRPLLDGPCTTADIGMIVASIVLVEHTRSGEYHGRHGAPTNERVAD